MRRSSFLRRLSDSDTLRDEIFNLQARNASLTERLSSLVGGDLDLHEEVTQCRALLARKDAELNELNELFCSIEDEVARARTERDDAQAHAARAEDAAAAAAGEKAEAAGRAEATEAIAALEARGREMALARLAAEQVGSRLLLEALIKADGELHTLGCAHRQALERSTSLEAAKTAALARDVHGRSAVQESLVHAQQENARHTGTIHALAPSLPLMHPTPQPEPPGAPEWV